jgi:hypothetical protein
MLDKLRADWRFLAAIDSLAPKLEQLLSMPPTQPIRSPDIEMSLTFREKIHA